MLELTIVSETGQSVRKIELSPGTSLQIGRARECDIRVATPTVSRHHAEVAAGESGWTFRDLGSTHGSFVNGERVGEVPVSPGLRVRIGPIRLEFDNLASRIGRELDRLLEEDDSRAGPARIEIIGRDGRRTAALDETMT
jgi:pSer/pThr/pTyr-binding forkhead associated (FHA) protein